jgi:hypothetical protein
MFGVDYMWKVSDLLWSLVPFFLPIIAGIYLLYVTVTKSMNVVNYVVGAIFIIFPLILGLGLYYYETKKDIRKSYLINDGLRCEAEILSLKKTGFYRNEHPQVKFVLKLTVPGDRAYQLEHNEYLNPLDVENLTEGAKIQVMVDPDNPKNILLVYY